MPRLILERRAVIESVAAATELPLGDVERLIATCRDAVDELIADDYSILAPPLVYATQSDPVFATLRRRFTSCSDAEAATVIDLDDDALAHWLGVGIDDVDRHPIAFVHMILGRALDRLGIPWTEKDDGAGWPDDVRAEAERLNRVLHSWIDSFADGRIYRVGPAGLEREFEKWLVEQLDRLADVGYPVRLEQRGRQRRLAGGRLIPDLLCRFTADVAPARRGDWLVVENKATAASIEAGDQVADYLALVRTELARPSELVFGLLMADGASARVQAHLSRLGIGYVSLSTVGYRRRDWPQVVSPGPAELDRLSTLVAVSRIPSNSPTPGLRKPRY